MCGELLMEIGERKEGSAKIETLVILSMAALDFSVVPGGIGTDQLPLDAQYIGCNLKVGRQVPLVVAKAVGKL